MIDEAVPDTGPPPLNGKRRNPHGIAASPERSRLRVGGLVFGVLASKCHAPSAPVCILIHGIGTSHRYLSRLHAELAADHSVYSIDLPGFGGLPKPRDTVTVAEMAAGLATVLEVLHVRRAIVIGHSMGSQWAVELAVQRPDLAAYVVAIGPVADEHHRTVWGQSLALAIDTLGEPVGGNVLVFGDYLRCGPPWYLRQLREMLSYPIEDRAAALVQPLLILRGDGDPIAGLEWSRRLRDSASAATLASLPRHRHLVQYSAPRPVASAIRDFSQDAPAHVAGAHGSPHPVPESPEAPT